MDRNCMAGELLVKGILWSKCLVEKWIEDGQSRNQIVTYWCGRFEWLTEHSTRDSLVECGWTGMCIEQMD